MEGGAADYQINTGDLVWAKMRGFPPWPGRVVPPVDAIKPPKDTGYHWIYFFGTDNHAWIEDRCIQPYLPAKDKYSKNKSSAFKSALAKIEEFIVKKNEDPDYELDIPPPAVTPTVKKQRKPVKRSSTSPSVTPNSSKRARPSSKSEENGEIEFERSSFLDASELSASSPKINLNHVSEAMKNKDISASSLAFGFLGLGNMGSGMVKNLINSGHHVNLWSRQPHKCNEIKAQADQTKAGLVNTYAVPCDVVQNSDIIFCCISDPQASKEIVYGNCGILHEAASLDGKGYVEMTGIDPDTSKVLSNAITTRGGRYLEAQVQGSKKEADEGTLLVLTAGDQTLFDDCQSCFKAIGKTAYYLGDVGYATKMNLIIQLMKGVALVGLAEGFALADKAGLSPLNMLEIFNLTSLCCPFLKKKADMIVKKEFSQVEQALIYMQKDMKLALDLSDTCKQPLTMAAVANEVFKHAVRLGYSNNDVSCVYMRARH